jgi:hypothetical protein
MRLTDLFFRAKTPSFGINPNYYISVLCSSAVLPSIRDLVQPKPEGAFADAIPGFGAPLTGDDANPEALKLPLQRGAYALATPDRKTMIRMLVMGVDEAQFNPRTYAESAAAFGEDPELLARMRGAWTITQFSFQSHSPAIFPSLLFLWQVTARLAALGDGVVADPLSERYRLPHEAYHEPDLKATKGVPIDVRDLVEVKRLMQAEGLYTYTMGLQKLGLPELELSRLDETSETSAVLFLLGLVQTLVKGTRLAPGHQVGSLATPFTIAVGGLDRSRWEGIAAFELLPPSHQTASQALQSWFDEQNG